MKLDGWTGIIALLACTASAIAEDSTATDPQSSGSASVRFVIHIPAQLSLSVTDSEAALVSLNEGLLSVASSDGQVSDLSWPAWVTGAPPVASTGQSKQGFIIASP